VNIYDRILEMGATVARMSSHHLNCEESRIAPFE